jgi:phage repressor protein C with HTH and peptisase S24 domain
MHPGPQIKRLRKEREWRLEDLATRMEKLLGKPVNTGNLSRLERKLQGYSNEVIQAAAEALEVEVAELFETGGQSPTLPKRASLRIARTGTETRSSSLDVEQLMGTYLPTEEPVEVPRLEVAASMGAGISRPGHDAIAGMMQLSAEWIRRNLPDITAPKNLRVITGYGNSMETAFFDGDPLLVDIGVREVRVDAVYVFAMDDELFIKTLQRIPGIGLKVISNNKTYEPYVIEEAAKVQLEVLGRIRWVWNGRKL